jgi:hypothetical protein
MKSPPASAENLGTNDMDQQGQLAQMIAKFGDGMMKKIRAEFQLWWHTSCSINYSKGSLFIWWLFGQVLVCRA